MKLVSWNVNGLRACMNKGFKNFMDSVDADVFCVQETKMQREQANFEFPGYFEYWNSAEKKGYSGTAIFSKTEPISVTYDMGIEEHDKEGRIICAEYDKFYLVNVYVPNAQRDLARLPYRVTWEDAFRSYVGELNARKPVLICGDMNVARNFIDIKNAKNNVGNAGFTNEERAKWKNFCSPALWILTAIYILIRKALIHGGPICLKHAKRTWDGVLTTFLYHRKCRTKLRTH